MTLSQKTKNFLSLVFRFGLSTVLLIYLFRKIDFTKTTEVLKTAEYSYLVYGFVIFIFINIVLLGRWFVYIRALELRTPFFHVVRYFFIGLFGNLFLPSAIGGDFIKVVGLCLTSPQKAKVVASVVLDRFSGFAGMVVVGVISYAIAARQINDVSLLGAIAVMAAVSLVVVTVLFNERLYGFCCRIFSPFPAIKEKVMNLHYTIALLKHRRYALYQDVGISCCGQILGASVLFMISKSLHQPVPLMYYIIFMPLICVAAAMPSIGGLGVREAGVVYLLGKVGVDSGIALSISLINFLLMVTGGLIGGMIFLVTNSKEHLVHVIVQNQSAGGKI